MLSEFLGFLNLCSLSLGQAIPLSEIGIVLEKSLLSSYFLNLNSSVKKDLAINPQGIAAALGSNFFPAYENFC